MNKALLDTDIYSEVLKAINPNVARNAAAYRQAHASSVPRRLRIEFEEAIDHATAQLGLGRSSSAMMSAAGGQSTSWSRLSSTRARSRSVMSGVGPGDGRRGGFAGVGCTCRSKLKTHPYIDHRALGLLVEAERDARADFPARSDEIMQARVDELF